LAASIQRATGVEPELVRGAGGIFDVAVDGDMIFSKHEAERFPEPDEILSMIRSL